MICNNCGADFDDQLANCPYCGHFSYTGARKEYMERLNTMKDSLEDLHETVPEMYSGEFRRQMKHTRKMIVIICCIIGIFALLLFGSIFLSNSFYKNDAKAELLFTKEAFPIADKYYASGDYEGLLSFYQTSVNENKNASFYNWEHYSFLMCYENYVSFKSAASLIGSEDFPEFYMTELFYCFFSTHYYKENQATSEEDRQLIFSLESEMQELIDQLELTEDETRQFEAFYHSEDYPSWNDIEKFSHKIYKRIF